MKLSARRLLAAFERVPFINADIDLPTESGVYFVVNKSWKILYIGQSKNMRQRWKDGHHKVLDCLRHGAHHIYFQHTLEPYDIEQIYIKDWEPPLNHRFIEGGF